jgi:hypothetical protein
VRDRIEEISMSNRLVVLLLLVGSSVLCAATVDAQGRQPSGQGSPAMPIRPAPPPDALPDLVVSAKATVVCAPQGTVTATIVATVKNQGAKAIADLSKIPWQIIVEGHWGFTGGEGFLEKKAGGTVKPQLGGPKTLKPGESWVGTLKILGIPKMDVAKAKAGGHLSSQFALWAIVDPLKGVAESNETNNTSATVYFPDPCYKP